MRKTLLIMCAGVCIASQAQAQQQQAQAISAVHGWRDASWGMTPEQLLAAFRGEAMQLPKPVERSLDRVKKVAPIGIDSFDLAGTRVNVRFLFSADSMRLAAVELQKFQIRPKRCMSDDRIPPADECLVIRSEADYDRLLVALTEKYGPPTLPQPNNGGPNGLRSTWTLPATVIQLFYGYTPGIAQYTTLIYRAVDPKARSLY